ncbi:MAG: hypothetical protein ACD_39C02099G0003 [uncultured bacterium]|nr:MAG: hypothetical protein ACD_39C02099G0003 [uncultured bacterium]
MRSYLPVFLLTRLCAIAMYLLGMALLVFPASELFLVNPVNWHKDFVRKQSQWRNALDQLTALTDESYTSGDDLQKRFNIELTEFIEQQTKDRLIEVTGKEWQGFFADLAAATKNTPADSSWLAAKGYFKTTMPPLDGIRKNFENDKTFFYVKITGENNRSEHLTVSLKQSGELFLNAPAHLAFPLRNAGCWLILAALILYFMQTGSSLRTLQVRLSHEKTSRGPDFIAALFAPAFVLTAGGVTAQIGFQALSQEWFMISGIFWLFAAIISTSWLVTAHYWTSSIDYSEQTVTFNSLLGSTEYDIARISEIIATPYKNPWWVKSALKIGAFFARNRSARKIHEDREYPGFAILCQDGSTGPAVCFNEHTGLTAFFKHIENHGIQISNSLKEKAASADIENSAAPWLVTRIFSRMVILSAVVATSYGIVATFALPDPQIKSSKLPDQSYSTINAENDEPTREELQSRVKRNAKLMEEVNQLSQQIQKLSDQMDKTTDPDERNKILAESDVIMQKLMELRNQQ